MIISLISILTANQVIGRKNSIPWYFSIDKLWFQYHTMGKPLIMGRKTFESIKKKPLLGRLNIVLSRTLKSNNDLLVKNFIIVNTMDQALSLIQESKEVMVIGGSTIYNVLLPKCNRMYLTYIDYIYKYGDIWFPEYNKDEWKLIFNVYKLYRVSLKIDYHLYFKILERY